MASKHRWASITRCCYCGKNVRQDHRTSDHLIAKSRGGNNDDFNVRMCCSSCNKEKENMTLDQYEQHLLRKLARVRYYSNFVKTFSNRVTGKDFILDYSPNQSTN